MKTTKHLAIVILWVLAVALCPAFSGAITVQEAKALCAKGRYSEAAEALRASLPKARASQRGQLSHLLGVCLYHTGNTSEAAEHLQYAASRGETASYFYLAAIEYADYNFREAGEHFRRYSEAMSSAGKPLTTEATRLGSQISLASEMIHHVEQITVIDSINVPANEFFRAYRLSPQVGSFLTSEQVSVNLSPQCTPVFATEGAQRLLWAQPDSSGVWSICSSSRLIDGSWEMPSPLCSSEQGDELRYPFVMPDGATIFFAAQGEGSIGGFDIFRSSLSAAEGTLTKPQNMGMPYNSPYNDYLLAIDEFTGVGWWASDRNQIPGEITIYVFIPNDVRRSCEGSDEVLRSLARLSRISDTWQEGADYSQLLNSIAQLEVPGRGVDTAATEAVHLEVAKGVVLSNPDDCKSAEGAHRFHQYAQATKDCNREAQRLKAFRRAYAEAAPDSRAQLTDSILSAEKNLITLRNKTAQLKNAAIKVLKKSIPNK